MSPAYQPPHRRRPEPARAASDDAALLPLDRPLTRRENTAPAPAHARRGRPTPRVGPDIGIGGMGGGGMRPSTRNWAVPRPRDAMGSAGMGAGNTGSSTSDPRQRGNATANVNANGSISSASNFRLTPAHARHSAHVPTTAGAQQGAGGMRPTRRTFTPLSEMELIASVSRSGGAGDGGDALKDLRTQERFRTYIDERIHRYHTDAAGGNDDPDSLKSIVLLFRKLREGIVASQRLDAFAIEVFESSVRYAILAHDAPQLLSALSGLVPGLYRAVDEAQRSTVEGATTSTSALGLSSLSPSADVDTLTNAVSNMSLVSTVPGDNRTTFASLLLLYYLVHSPRAAYFSTLVALAMPQPRRLRVRVYPDDDGAGTEDHGGRPTSRPADTGPQPTPFVSLGSLEFARTAARALAPETFDPLLFANLVRSTDTADASEGEQAPQVDTSPQPPADSLERALLAWAAPSVRTRAGDVLRKAYVSAGVAWAATLLNVEEHGVDAWAMAAGLTVRDGVVKLR